MVEIRIRITEGVKKLRFPFHLIFLKFKPFIHDDIDLAWVTMLSLILLPPYWCLTWKIWHPIIFHWPCFSYKKNTNLNSKQQISMSLNQSFINNFPIPVSKVKWKYLYSSNFVIEYCKKIKSLFSDYWARSPMENFSGFFSNPNQSLIVFSHAKCFGHSYWVDGVFRSVCGKHDHLLNHLSGNPFQFSKTNLTRS